eukprot:6214606-Pleurochrysis_carterae.AAC.2
MSRTMKYADLLLGSSSSLNYLLGSSIPVLIAQTPLRSSTGVLPSSRLIRAGPYLAASSISSPEGATLLATIAAVAFVAATVAACRASLPQGDDRRSSQQFTNEADILLQYIYR